VLSSGERFVDSGGAFENAINNHDDRELETEQIFVKTENLKLVKSKPRTLN
jgi:hypothetical protein